VGQPDRRMQAWSPLHTSSSTPYFTRHALAALEQAGDPGLDAALALELAFALGDDHLQAVEVAGEGLLQRARMVATS
jgi:hypothetical protein